MSFEPGPRPHGGGRRWMVRLFETSDKLEEHLNRSDLRPDQVASINVDGDGFFVLVYWVGGGAGPAGPGPAFERRPRPEFEERRPFRRPGDEGEGERGDEGERFERRPRGFEGPPPRRFEGPPPRRFDGPPPRRFDGPPPPRRPGPPRRRDR